jgi:hypothetical protein
MLTSNVNVEVLALKARARGPQGESLYLAWIRSRPPKIRDFQSANLVKPVASNLPSQFPPARQDTRPLVNRLVRTPINPSRSQDLPNALDCHFAHLSVSRKALYGADPAVETAPEAELGAEALKRA